MTPLPKPKPTKPGEGSPATTAEFRFLKLELVRIEKKVDAIAAAIGGSELKRRMREIDRDLGPE